MKVLDYGSNDVVWSNLSNKLDTKSIDLMIYDPFSDGPVSTDLEPLFKKIEVISQIHLTDDIFDLIIYGSSVQYIKDFVDDFEENFNFKSKFILFTHTPLSISESFVSKQFSDFTGNQHIHAYRSLRKKLEDNSYELIFKSTLDPENASVEEHFLNKIPFWGESCG